MKESHAWHPEQPPVAPEMQQETQNYGERATLEGLPPSDMKQNHDLEAIAGGAAERMAWTLWSGAWLSALGRSPFPLEGGAFQHLCS